MAVMFKAGHGITLAVISAGLLGISGSAALASADRHRPTPVHAAAHAATAPVHGKHGVSPHGHPTSVAGMARVGRHNAVTATGKPARAAKVASVTTIQPVIPDQDAERPLIVIDPGHGGHDPGAIGTRGTQEKDVTLAIGRELRRALEQTGRYRTAMTRSRDTSVSLANRLHFAREHDADLLIAIHADASPDHHARGASVYVSSGQSVSHLAANTSNSAQIAQALASGDTHPEAGSAWLQSSMIDQLSDDVQMVVAPARSAHLYVLGSRHIPSVLLETGFISNRQDEVLLAQPVHRRLLVGAIRDAIDDYFHGLKSSAPKT